MHTSSKTEESRSRGHHKHDSHKNEEVKFQTAPDEDMLLKTFFEISTKREDANSLMGNADLQMANSRRKADLLYCGAKFIKGNRYDLANKDGEKAQTPKEEEPEKPANGKKREERYFMDKSTIRCRKCKEFGHISTVCPNDGISDKVCIYCAETTHEQYDCMNRLCFKCNQRGHKAFECRDRNPKRCFRCEEAGHKSDSCVINPTPIIPRDQQKIVCMQCRRQGHPMCQVPAKLNVRWPILDEYKAAKKQMLRKLAAANNDNGIIGDGLGVPLSDLSEDEDKSLTSKPPHKMTSRAFRDLTDRRKQHKRKLKLSREIYCCYCGDHHAEKNCRQKPQSKGAHDMNIRRKVEPPKSSEDASFERLFEKYGKEHHGREHDYGHREETGHHKRKKY